MSNNSWWNKLFQKSCQNSNSETTKIELSDFDKQYFKERQKMGFDGWHYSVQRIDLLIVTISGAGVYVALESLKYCLDHPKMPQNLLHIKLSGLIFICAIIFNLLSQFAGKKANQHDMFYWDERLKGDIEETVREDLKADQWSKVTDTLNNISILLMLGGLITFIIYYFVTF